MNPQPDNDGPRPPRKPPTRVTSSQADFPDDGVWNAISAFEQILEAIPDDRASLEALWNAYEQIGELDKSRHYLIRMAKVLLKENDKDAAAELLDKLRKAAAEDGEAAGVVARIQDMLAGVPSKQPEPLPREIDAGFSMPDGLSLLWTLREEKQVSEQEYAAAVQDFSERSLMFDPPVVSALHVLARLFPAKIDGILNYTARACGTPLISLAELELNGDETKLLPMYFMLEYGALVFGRSGRTLLVVITDPWSRQLRAAIESRTECKCHFFLCRPQDFDDAIRRIRAGEQ